MRSSRPDGLARCPASGAGIVCSFAIVEKPIEKAFSSLVPYVIAIELEEGIRMLSHVVDVDPVDVTCGMRVCVRCGMISNLRSQLRDMDMEDRLYAVLEEAGQVREDLGYPILVSPFAQFVITQAVINVVPKERYAIREGNPRHTRITASAEHPPRIRRDRR